MPYLYGRSPRVMNVTADPQFLDEHRHRPPYREGPYDFHHLEDGRLIKKRWCKWFLWLSFRRLKGLESQVCPYFLICFKDGTFEDGYLAWSSIYLHEYFGFHIYTPIAPEQQEEMKRDEYIPDWMEKMYWLPNIAIPISYFCIGVALQLLRTPLISYNLSMT
jgi:hypothetical protein